MQEMVHVKKPQTLSEMIAFARSMESNEEELCLISDSIQKPALYCHDDSKSVQYLPVESQTKTLVVEEINEQFVAYGEAVPVSFLETDILQPPAHQMFALRPKRLRDKRKLNLSPKTWMFKFKTSNLQHSMRMGRRNKSHKPRLRFKWMLRWDSRSMPQLLSVYMQLMNKKREREHGNRVFLIHQTFQALVEMVVLHTEGQKHVLEQFGDTLDEEDRLVLHSDLGDEVLQSVNWRNECVLQARTPLKIIQILHKPATLSSLEMDFPKDFASGGYNTFSGGVTFHGDLARFLIISACDIGNSLCVVWHRWKQKETAAIVPFQRIQRKTPKGCKLPCSLSLQALGRKTCPFPRQLPTSVDVFLCALDTGCW